MLRKIELISGYILAGIGMAAFAIGAAGVDASPLWLCFALMVGGLFTAIFGGMLVEASEWDL